MCCPPRARAHVPGACSLLHRSPNLWIHMRILLVAPQPFYQERGTPIAVRVLLETLCSQGHTVDLLTYHEGRDVEIGGLRILRTPAVPGVRNVPVGISWQKLICDLLLCWKLLWLSVSQKYDVIHAVEEAAFPVILLRPLHRARVVYDMDSILQDQLVAKWRLLRPVAPILAWLERSLMRHVDAVFAACKDLAAHASNEAPGVPAFVIEDVAWGGQDASCAAGRLGGSGVLGRAMLVGEGRDAGSQVGEEKAKTKVLVQ